MSEDSASASGDSMELPPEVMHDTSNDPYSNGPLSFQNGFNRGNVPYVEIAEQPQQRGFRFRYRCEGPSHGGLQGEHSVRGNKSYPAIKICNYSGPARIIVTLVTDEKQPRTHAHELMGKHCKDGICMIEVQEGIPADNSITFPNLGILHVTKKKVESILVERLTELERVVQEMATGRNSPISDERKRDIARQAKEDSKKMQLNVVRLKFSVFLPEGHTFAKELAPVFTNPIYDSKCPGVAGLNICRMDRNAGCCTGHEEVFLLCDKVQKDDILVRFFEVDEDNHVKWESFGNFGPSDVHRQYAIVFKTPPYMSQDINHPVHVNVQLRRISDHETSEPKPFTYYPQQHDKNEVGKKRKKTLPFPNNRSGSLFLNNNHRSFFNPNSGNNQANSNNISGGGNTTTGSVNNRSVLPSYGGLQAAGPLIGNVSSDPQVTAASASGFSVHQSNQNLNFSQMNINLSLLDPQMQTSQTQLTHMPSQMQSPQMMCKVPQVSLPEVPLTISTSVPGTLTDRLALEDIETILAQSSVDMTQTSPLNVNQNPICTSQSQIMPQTSVSQQIFSQQSQKQQPLLHQQTQQHQQQQPLQQQQFMQTAIEGYAQIQNQHIPYGDTPQQAQTHQQHFTQQPYSPGQAQYSPASQQTYSPGAQQCYSPGVPQQQSYSPGAQHQYSPESAQHYSPPHQVPQRSPPSQHYIFQASDLVMDGGDVDTDTPESTVLPGSFGGDIECDSGDYIDDDLQEDAVPIAPEKAKVIAREFHDKKGHQTAAEADKELLQDLEKMTLTEKEKDVEKEKVTTDRGKIEIAEGKKAGENVEEDEEQLLESVAKSGLVLALNVARRTVVALHNYAQTGDPIYMILCQRHLVSVQDDLGDTALHMSIIHGRSDVSLQLLRAVSTLRHCAAEIVNITNILNQTPLQLAVITKQASLIPPLLKLGAARHLVDKRGESPLHLAAKMGHNLCLVNLLHEMSEEEEGQSHALEKLNFDGFSPLHLAVMHQHPDCVQTLLNAGIDVNHCDGRSGRTALHHATETNNLSIARQILEKPDVDVDAHAYDGSTALHIGVGRKLNDIVRLLVYHNADPKKENFECMNEDDEDEEDICVDSDVDKVYIRPIDLAESNPEMLDILFKRDEQRENYLLRSQISSESEGDVDQLDQNTRSALSEKLDPLLAGGDWQALAKGLNLTSAMDGFRLQPSPTLHLLDTYKIGKGTLQELRRVLNDMKRYDAAALVDDVISRVTTECLPEYRPEITQLSKRPLSGDKTFDSGLGSMSLTLNSCS